MTSRPLSTKCPRCGLVVSWPSNPHRPFCSKRCQLIDLGRWASGDYLIPGAKIDPESSNEENFNKTKDASSTQDDEKNR